MQNYVGKQIDRYRIIERLGMGGMAVVYKAYDTRLERDVALKLIRVDEIPASQHERLMKRFEREAKAMAKFSHPNIVPVYDYGEVDDSPYLVMEYIPGGTMKEKTGRPVPVETALSWVAPIADALAYAHEFGVVHRDIKPSNILFNQKGRPILTDFGVAKMLETDEATLTGTGMGVGTPEYMAPEQWRGRTCPATDQYALGVVLYELLTGRKPYTADTPAALVILQATEPLTQPSMLVEGISEEVEKVLYKALARDPRDRYEDMEACSYAIRSISTSKKNNLDDQDNHKINNDHIDQDYETENSTFDGLFTNTYAKKTNEKRNFVKPKFLDSENEEQKKQSEKLNYKFSIDADWDINTEEENEIDLINDDNSNSSQKSQSQINHRAFNLIILFGTIGGLILSAFTEINFVGFELLLIGLSLIFIPSLFTQLVKEIKSFFNNLVNK